MVNELMTEEEAKGLAERLENPDKDMQIEGLYFLLKHVCLPTIKYYQKPQSKKISYKDHVKKSFVAEKILKDSGII